MLPLVFLIRKRYPDTAPAILNTLLIVSALMLLVGLGMLIP